MIKQKMKILGVCGSLDPESRTLKALKICLEGCGAAGAETSLLNLRDYQLPILNSPYRFPKSEDHALKMKRLFHDADGLVLATPEYHGSFSGALKNALDTMGFEEFEGKMVGLIGVAGGSLGAGSALSHLRSVCRQLHAWVIPDQVSIANAYDAFDKQGRLKAVALMERLYKLGADVARFTFLHSQEKTNAFVQLWEKAVHNPGGEGR